MKSRAEWGAAARHSYSAVLTALRRGSSVVLPSVLTELRLLLCWREMFIGNLKSGVWFVDMAAFVLLCCSLDPRFPGLGEGVIGVNSLRD